ncbi:Histone-lysine N-methyltransferase atxr4 [Trifolium repens]|nr:Histone-lysine N-methyltransferase atxr4 [Trifolium repens]
MNDDKKLKYPYYSQWVALSSQLAQSLLEISFTPPSPPSVTLHIPPSIPFAIHASPDSLTSPPPFVLTVASNAEYYDVEMKANWEEFDNYCRNRGLKYPFLVKRLACMIISGVTRSDSIDILQPANLTPEMILEMEEEFTLLRNAFTKALIEDEQIAFLTKQWYISVLARIRINAFRIELAGGGSYEDLLSSAFASVEAEAGVGNAVYILPSFYNHDCDPNAHIIWIDNAVAKLKTLRDIDEGEELRICYIDASMDHNARRKLLFRGFGFHCNCSRCLHGD